MRPRVLGLLREEAFGHEFARTSNLGSIITVSRHVQRGTGIGEQLLDGVGSKHRCVHVGREHADPILAELTLDDLLLCCDFVSSHCRPQGFKSELLLHLQACLRAELRMTADCIDVRCEPVEHLLRPTVKIKRGYGVSG